MSPASKKIEVVANTAVILAAIIPGFVLIRKFVLADESAPNSPKRPQVGAHVYLPCADCSSKDKNLILAQKKGCKYCTESAAFYQRPAFNNSLFGLIQKSYPNNKEILCSLAIV